jgi:hypothetical protein
VFAYLDTNAVEDLCRLRAGVTERERDVILAAVLGGQLIVPASQFVAEELLAAVNRCPDVARQCGGFYADLISTRHVLLDAFDALQATFRALARYSVPPPPYHRLDVGQIAGWNAVAHLSSSGVGSVVETAAAQIERFRKLVTIEGVGSLKDSDITLTSLYRSRGAEYAATLAEEFGVDRELRGRYAEVIENRVVAAAVVGFLALLHSQVISGRKVKRADSRDLQHMVLAAATGGPLVSGDGRLGKLLAAGSVDLEVLTVSALAARLT